MTNRSPAWFLEAITANSSGTEKRMDLTHALKSPERTGANRMGSKGIRMNPA